MAIVAEGDRGRLYLSPTPEHEVAPEKANSNWQPDGAFVEDARAFTPFIYGLGEWKKLFTGRQMVALTCYSDLVGEAMERVRDDARRAGLGEGTKDPREGAMSTSEYADGVGTYLGIAQSRLADMCNNLCAWETTKTQVRHLFTRQALPMLWDFAENNVFNGAGGDYSVSLGNMVKALERLPGSGFAQSRQEDAQSQSLSKSKVVSTDPPYYDNVPYADLSDFFYVWLRKSLRPVFPDLFATMAVPKAEELVATSYRHGGKGDAEKFFLDGMTHAMHRLAELAHSDFPVTIYYAFKQSEGSGDHGSASTGWETFLDAVIRAGFAISGTWPMRTELENRMRGIGFNALASSIVLVCRPRAADAPTATRREFVAALQRELPAALRHLQAGNIAPVDLAQAAIGPGMAVFTRYAQVLDAQGHAMRVREALALINETLDTALAEQEGDFDPDSRWALAWFEQFGFDDGEFGIAEVLATAKATSIIGLQKAGILQSGKGKVRLLRPEELPADWDPAADPRLTHWETVHHLIRVLADGEGAAAELVAKLGAKAEPARELAYRLYTLCERKKRAAEALAYNGLVQAWPDLLRQAEEVPPEPVQGQLL
jgi:putative DNA methylase